MAFFFSGRDIQKNPIGAGANKAIKKVYALIGEAVYVLEKMDSCSMDRELNNLHADLQGLQFKHFSSQKQ